MRTLPLALLAPLLLAPSGARASTQPFVDLEAGVALTTSNDVQVPGDTGTRFSLASGDFSTAGAPYIRVTGGVQLGRHVVYGVWQPLRLEANGTPSGPITFAGSTFGAGVPVKGHYQLDTYRLTYRYTLVESHGLLVALGATALLRDAQISLQQGQLTASKSSVSVLPLASFRLAWQFAGPVGVFLDGDALATKQARTEDVAAGLVLESGDFDFRVFYRVLEGGTDSAAVYNFALIHQPGAGVMFRF